MKTKNILITGLCLSRNRGGPAMALSFMDQIKRHLSAKFVFAVDPIYIKLEREWAEQYGVGVVPRDSINQWLITQLPPLRLIRRLKRRLQNRVDDTRFWHSVHREYQKAFDWADCIINLNGIAFVGDGTYPWRSSLSNRTSSIYAKRCSKPFFRFIQSYGPFKDWRVKLLARREFTKLPCIMARGRLSAHYCKKIAGKVPVYAFPDVAITLQPASDTWLKNYLNRFNLKRKSYIVLSPSAVISSMLTRAGSSVGKKHISVFTTIAKHYLSIGEPILFVPHMTSPTPSQCDRAVCKQVIERLVKEGVDTSHCYVINDELDCRELKALIGGAKLAIVSRYHALVAALSTGVPVVTAGWNDKYQDLLDFYGSAKFAVDARRREPSIISKAILKKANAWTDNQIKLIKDRQPKLESMIDRAGELCADWILRVTKKKVGNIISKYDE